MIRKIVLLEREEIERAIPLYIERITERSWWYLSYIDVGLRHVAPLAVYYKNIRSLEISLKKIVEYSR